MQPKTESSNSSSSSNNTKVYTQRRLSAESASIDETLNGLSRLPALRQRQWVVLIDVTLPIPRPRPPPLPEIHSGKVLKLLLVYDRVTITLSSSRVYERA